jgi:hypothetical protein
LAANPGEWERMVFFPANFGLQIAVVRGAADG